MAAYLNGSTQYFSNGPPFSAVGANFAIAFWFYTPTYAVPQICIGLTSSGGLGASVLSAAQVELTFYTVSDYDFGTSLAVNTWHHIAFNKVGSTLTAYVDGASIGSLGVGTFVAPSGGNAFIGARNNGGPDNYVNGRLAEMAIWNADISSQITALRSGAAAGSAPNNIGITPAYYWPLDTDGTATLGGLNLTAVNSPSFTTHAAAGLTITGGGGGGGETLMGVQCL